MFKFKGISLPNVFIFLFSIFRYFLVCLTNSQKCTNVHNHSYVLHFWHYDGHIGTYWSYIRWCWIITSCWPVTAINVCLILLYLFWIWLNELFMWVNILFICICLQTCCLKIASKGWRKYFWIVLNVYNEQLGLHAVCEWSYKIIIKFE